MPLYEPVAYYHHHKNYLKQKTEYLDDDDSDVEIYHDDKRGFISSNSHFYENALSSRQRSVRLPESSSGDELQLSRTPSREESLDKDDVAAAEEILDGCRPRKPSPLTIIQVKNPESHLDDADWLGAFAVRKICIFAIFGIGICLSFVAALSWTLTYCEDGLDEEGNSCRNAAFLMLQGKTTPKEGSMWTKVFDGIVLTGGIQIVNRKITSNPNINHHPIHEGNRQQQFDEDLLVSGYLYITSTTYNTTSLQHSSQKHGKQQEQLLSGLIGVKVSDGTESWRRPFINNEPSKHNCRLLDTNSDGTQDCIVVGNHGLLSAIDPNNGIELWRLHYHLPLVNISLPRVLPDLDGDLVPDLVAACAVTLPSGISDDHIHIRNNFILISGKSGKVQGRPYLVEQCTDLSVLNVTSNLELQFDCQGISGPDEFEMSLNEFYLRVTNQELPVAMKSTVDIRDEPSFGEYQQSDAVGEDQVEAIRDSIHLDWTPTRSNCPECGVNVKIWENFAHRRLWNKTWMNSIAFQPLSMRYETDRWDSPIEGFVFRLWTWQNPKDTFTLGKDKLINNYKYTTEAEFRQKKINKHETSAKNRSSEKEDEEDPELNSFNNIYKSHNNDQDYHDNDEEENALQAQQASPYSFISNLLPFGHPNLGISQRRLLAVENNVILSKTNTNYIAHSKRKKHHRKSAKKKMHNSHHRTYDYDYQKNKEKTLLLNQESTNTFAAQTFLSNGMKGIIRPYREQTRYLNVTETIFYATLNHTNLRIVGLFNHTIVQKCTYLSSQGTYKCSPHYNSQSNSMVILDDDNQGRDADARDLLFTTQSFVNKTKNGKRHVEKEGQVSTPAHVQDNNLGTSFIKNRKYKSELKQDTNSDYEWVMETRLHKRKLKKDIDVTRHL